MPPVGEPSTIEGDEMRHECGVFGVYAPGYDVARLTYFGLFTLQHRGQESAGIAVSDGDDVVIHKQMGLVNQIFDEATLSRLRGHMAVGHVRYSTTGSSVIRNAQPMLIGDHELSIAVAHNGNLVNSKELRERLERRGVIFHATSDTEIIAHLLHRELAFHAPLEEAFANTMAELSGAYCLVVLTENELVAARDPHGLHPLCIGRLNGDGYVVASETCALNAVGARFVRDLEPGEVAVIDEDGLRVTQAVPPAQKSMCIFETIYFARPDSHIYGRTLHVARRRMGEQLYHECPARADVVIPVPDTGTPGAIGYAAASGIPFDSGLVKSRYIQRTFIQPDQRQREMGIRLKFTPIPETVSGRSVVLVDDSIVRGTTTRKLVSLVREAGAREVHLRIFSPPIKWPCFYGIDMATREELIASSHTIEEIRQTIGADSLGYLSTRGLALALGVDAKHFCWACLTGRYPIEVPQHLRDVKMQLHSDSCGGPEDPEEREPVRILAAALGEETF